MTNDDPTIPVEYLHHPEHGVGLYIQANHEVRARCACGAEWTYPRSATHEHIVDVCVSHVKYFDRPKTETL